MFMVTSKLIGALSEQHSYILFVFFFFSSRRRHTRCSRDWSSDVCSSDLRRRARSEPDARAGGVRGLGGNRHQPEHPDVVELRHPLQQLVEPLGGHPPFDGSRATFTWTRASTGRPPCWARLSSSRASSARSTEWIRSKSSAASLALFVCSCPTRCHGTGRPSSAIFARAS